MNLKLINTDSGIIVVNKHTKKHTHINNEDTAYAFMRRLRNGQLPKSKYLRESARRILTHKEFAQLEPKKAKYKNKGGRKR